jgi:hypothetical protein
MVFTAYLDFIVGWFAVLSMQADCLSIFIWSISGPSILSWIIGSARLNVELNFRDWMRELKIWSIWLI